LIHSRFFLVEMKSLFSIGSDKKQNG
jgi:hypothetical protein